MLRYTTLTEIAILNSDPSRDGTEANGYLAVYDGETLAFERSDLVWRTNATVFFSKVMAQSASNSLGQPGAKGQLIGSNAGSCFTPAV